MSYEHELEESTSWALLGHGARALRDGPPLAERRIRFRVVRVYAGSP